MLNRREFLTVTATAPLALANLGITGRINAAEARTRKPLIILFLSGGISAKEFVNPDPATAPAELRGSVGTVATRTAGVRFSEVWPELAARQDKFATLRALDAGTSDHTPGQQTAVLQGTRTISQKAGEAATRNGVDYVLLNPGSTWYGLRDAFRMGDAFTPIWDSKGRRFLPPQAGGGVSAERRSLLEAFDTQAIDSPQARRMDRFRATAFDLLQGGGDFFRALNMSDKDKARYGSSLSGDMVLTAKQFIERGAGAVTIYHEPDPSAWDMHGDIDRRMRGLSPEMDRAAATLIDEIDQHRLDCVLLMMGEIPRTPRINGGGGRDHWQLGNTAILAGGNVRKGAVFGRTNPQGQITADGVQQRNQLGNTVLIATGAEIPPADPRVRDILT